MENIIVPRDRRLTKEEHDIILNEYRKGATSRDERTKEEKQKQWRKDYYQQHKEEILNKHEQQYKVKITCDICGSTFRRRKIRTFKNKETQRSNKINKKNIVKEKPCYQLNISRKNTK